MSSLAELRQELVGLRAPNTSTGAFTALSRIACGHPEGGGLRIPSLNWYEDNDVKAFLDRNSSEQRPVASGSTSEWGAVEAQLGAAGGSGGWWCGAGGEGSALHPQVPSAGSCSAAWSPAPSHRSSGGGSSPSLWGRSCTHPLDLALTVSWLR